MKKLNIKDIEVKFNEYGDASRIQPIERNLEMKNHGTWAEYVKSLADEYIGVKVHYDGKIYKIVKVDYNGVMHINKPSAHNETTAVFANRLEAEKARI